MEEKRINYTVDPSDGDSRALWVHLKGNQGVWDFLAVLDDDDNWTDKQISYLALKASEAYFEGLSDRDWTIVQKISKVVTDAIDKAEDAIEPVGDVQVSVTRIRK